jgi:serine phosphatase RsbU (regulator of sigma subunit)/tetratricopeptide (TPR) repeat protein
MKKRRVRLIFLIGCLQCAVISSFAQSKTDSLSAVIKNTSSDTIKLKSLNSLFKELYYSGKTDSAMNCAMYTKGLAEKLLNTGVSINSKTHFTIQQQRIVAYSNIGKLYLSKGVFIEALKYDTLALNIAREAGDKLNIANAYGNIGALYTSQGNYVEALKNEFASLKIDEELGNTHGIASAYTNIGNSYLAENNFPEALKNHQACLKISQEAGFKQGMIWAYNNIGDVYENSGRHEEAIKSYLECLKESKEAGYKEGIAVSFANMGAIQAEDRKYEEALKNESASLEMYKQLGYGQDAANLYINIGEVFLKQEKYNDAETYITKGLQMAVSSKYREEAKHAYKDLSGLFEILAKSGVSPAENWERAHENYKLYDGFKDSLNNDVTAKKMVQAQMQFDFDKKESAAKEEQLKKDATEAQERQRQKFILNGFIIGFILLSFLVFFIFRGYRQKQRANIIIGRQKEEVEKKNSVIESKNKDITDSINYAQRIQNAMLPSEEEIESMINEYFILFQPKAIVSGDFYFVSPQAIEEGKGIRTIVAAADCTGHGVPGAFMSLIGNEKLRDAVEQGKNTGEVLKFLNRGIKSSLRQSSDLLDSSRDGMDIALLSLDKQVSATGLNVQFSSANRPLWIIRNGANDIEEIKPTKNSIGGFTDDDAVFETSELELKKGDSLYIFTDGYTDQFGGLDGKKLTTKKFREVLLSFRDKTMKEQKEKLMAFLNEWKGNNEQLDDILVIGLRV